MRQWNCGNIKKTKWKTIIKIIQLFQLIKWIWFKKNCSYSQLNFISLLPCKGKSNHFSSSYLNNATNSNTTDCDKINKQLLLRTKLKIKTLTKLSISQYQHTWLVQEKVCLMKHNVWIHEISANNITNNFQQTNKRNKLGSVSFMSLSVSTRLCLLGLSTCLKHKVSFIS